MNWRKHIVLVIGGGLSIVLILAAAVMLFRYRSEYVRVQATAQAAETRLGQLNAREAFPSQENVQQEKKNVDVLDKYFVDLMAGLAKDQKAIPAVEPAEFAPMLEKTRQRVLSRATSAGVKMPDRMGLGFARYTEGALPSTADIPRLVMQLQASEAVMDLLFDARATEIYDIQREVFETIEDSPADTGARGGRRAAPQAAQGNTWKDVPRAVSNELYGAERIYVSFAAKEPSVWPLLNTLASCQPFIVLVDVHVVNPLGLETRKSVAAAPSARAPAAAIGRAAAAAPGTKPESLDREQRVVSGREAVKIEMLLDVYRFNDVAQKGAAP